MLTSSIIEAGEFGKPVLFNWSLIDKCQFKCAYCYSTDFNKGNNFEKGLYRKSHLLVLHKLSKLKFDWTIDLLGGEPTLHPNILDIISSLEKIDYCKEIVLSTNLTAGVNFYKQLDQKDTKVELHVSYHPEYHKKIFNKINKLHDSLNHLKLFVEVMLYPKKKYFNQMEEFLDQLTKKQIPFGINLIHENDFWDGKVDDGFYQMFDKWINADTTLKTIKHKTTTGVEYYSEDDIIKRKVSYKGFKCQAMTYSIDINGDIFNTCSHEKLPTIFNEDDVKKIIICPVETCGACSAMLYYKKFANEINR